MGEILEIVYHGPAPVADAKRVQPHTPATERMSLDAFLAAIKAAQREEDDWLCTQQDQVTDGTEFRTSSEYMESMRRHTRMEKDPRNKFKYPTTASMNHGWVEGNPNGPRAAKKSCEETVFASELIKAGVYY